MAILLFLTRDGLTPAHFKVRTMCVLFVFPVIFLLHFPRCCFLIVTQPVREVHVIMRTYPRVITTQADRFPIQTTAQ